MKSQVYHPKLIYSSYIHFMKVIYSLVLTVFILFPGMGLSQRLDPFTSHTDQNSDKGAAERIPYTATTGFYDFISDGQLPDSVVNGQPYYYVYFRIPLEVTEIGVRMISPVPSYVYPDAGDVVTDTYESNKKSAAYFNPFLFLEQGVPGNATNLSFQMDKWELLEKNDDHSELMAQPSGKNTNSLLRVFAGPYPPGIYRIKFRASEKNVPQGSYLIQFGCIPGVKRMKISRTAEGLFAD